MLERIALSGPLLAIPDKLSFLRLVVAMILSMLGTVFVLFAMPYSRPWHNLASIATHVGLELIFVGALIIKLHARVTEEATGLMASSVFNFSSVEPLVATIMFFAGFVFLLVLGILAMQIRAENKLPILLTKNGTLPHL